MNDRSEMHPHATIGAAIKLFNFQRTKETEELL